MTKEFSYQDIEAATEGFAADRLIGKGSHGWVYRGTLQGGREVAVKKPSQTAGEGSKLDGEMEILGSLRHPNIVNLIGACSHGPASNKLLVMELMPNGSLHHLLHSSAATPLPWPRRALLALQVARAIRFLHGLEPPVVHRDVKSDNILFDGRWDARLADFSLAVRGSKEEEPMPAGTLGYLDPGYTAPGKLGPEVDVFSFGVVLLELVSSRRAMEVDGDATSIVAWAVPMIRDGRAADACDGRLALGGRTKRGVERMLRVAARCVSGEEEGRPGMAEVVGELRGVVESTVWWPAFSWVWLTRSGVCGRVDGCVGAWRRCKEKRVASATTTTTVVAFKDHLMIECCDEPRDCDHSDT